MANVNLRATSGGSTGKSAGVLYRPRLSLVSNDNPVPSAIGDRKFMLPQTLFTDARLPQNLIFSNLDHSSSYESGFELWVEPR